VERVKCPDRSKSLRKGNLLFIIGFQAELKIVKMDKGRKQVKEKIHPKYFDTTITCACGNVIKTRSTVKDLHVEICSNCHPFFTGRQKLVDTAGRIDRFRKKYGLDKTGQAKTPVAKTKKADKS